ncbi:MAG: energy-coupling factor transporter transmembrane component T [Chloroflexota bacterium]
MRLFTPLVPDATAPLARANPIAKLGAALLLMFVLFVSDDLLTPSILLAGLLATLPLTGLAPRVLIARTWPLLVVATSVGVLNALFAPEQAGALIQIGPAAAGAQNLLAGLALGVRLLTIAGVGVVTLATIEPTDLADALVQQLGVSPRFAVGALAALRLLPILADEWQLIRLARRARGVDAGRSAFAAAGIFFGELLTLLVSAVRRATRLALAMEARGLGSRPCRGIARPQRVGAGDLALLVAAALLAAGAVGVGLAAGTYRFIFA